jgi:ParB family chromosome partitioning protein
MKVRNQDARSGAPSPPIKGRVREIPVAKIVTKGRFRTPNKVKLNALTDSMSLIGLATPITVRKTRAGYQLVAGHHRLEAAKALGWTKISVFVSKGRKRIRRLWKISENLHRTELTALEEAEQVARWAALSSAHSKAAQLAHPGGNQPHDRGVSKGARALARSRDDVRRSKIIAGIAPKAKAAAKKAGLDDNQSALLKIAKAPSPKAQLRRVVELAHKKTRRKPPRGPDEQEQFKKLKDAFKKSGKFRQRWSKATNRVRQDFIEQVLRRA